MGGYSGANHLLKQEELTMTTTKTTLTAVCVAALGATSLHADDSVFSVSAFIAGIEGQGFVGNESTEVGETWDFPSGQEGSYYVHNVNDLPIEFEELLTSPSGGSSYGHSKCTAEVTSTNITLQASNLGVVDGGETGEYADAYAQVHGEFHILIDKPALIEFDLCNETNGTSAWGKLYLRKLQGANFATMYENVTSSDSGEECVTGSVQVEPGIYQLYFSSYIYMNNGSIGVNGWEIAASDSVATLNITEINVADINGDGTVDGADLARLLGAWGTSASGADLNGDGIVNGADLALLLAAWD